MFYDAICIDTANYINTGTIRVRVFALVNYPRTKENGETTGLDDLSKVPEIIKLGENEEGKTLDANAMVFAPFGGGRNYGMFYLPQVNSKGLITFIDGDIQKPLWVGSYFEGKHKVGDYDSIDYINSPSDDVENDGVDKDAYANGSKNFTNTTSPSVSNITDSLVIRTKHTTMSKSDGDKMDFQKQPTKNLIVINNTSITIRHYTAWDNGKAKKYQEIKLNDINLQTTISSVDGDKVSTIALTPELIEIKVDDGKASPVANIKIKAGEVNFIDDGDNLVTYADLKTIIDKLEAHKHVRFPGGGADGLTGEPVIGQGTPLSSDITGPKRDMKAALLKAHQGS